MTNTINITKGDIAWSYVAMFFQLATGLIVLPLILKLLSAEEVGFNYLMLSVGSIINLFDFGFSNQLGRNITYAYSGACNILKSGVDCNVNGEINYDLLVKLIKTSKKAYRIISSAALLCMLIFGSIYIYHITHGFSLIKDSFCIWILFCISSFFNLYFLYFNSFLTGKGLIKESKKAMVYSRITQVLLTILFLLCGLRLIGVVMANLISPFVFRYFASHYFYDNSLRQKIEEIHVSNEESKTVFLTLWYNMKRIGIISILASVTSYLSTFLLGFFWNLSDVASYGLMIQIGGIIASLSNNMFNSNIPLFSSLILNNDMENLKKKASFTIFVFYLLFILGSIGFLMVPYVLDIIGSHAKLPSCSILIVYSILNLLSWNQAVFSQLLMAGNDLIFFKSAAICGVLNLVFTLIALTLGMNIMGVVIMQNIPVLLIMDWKWPFYVMRKYKIRFFQDIIENSVTALYNKTKNLKIKLI
jgi:O-antigen/teichoic acid export membrane protein